MRRWGIIVPPLGAARSVMESMSKAFQEIGESVTVIDSKGYEDAFVQLLRPENEEMASEIANQSWVCKAVEESWTHVLIGALAPVTNWTLAHWKKLGITVVFWNYESYPLVKYWEEQLPQIDLFCAVQKEPVRSIAGDGFRFLPTAADSVTTDPIIPPSQRRYDCAFVGIPSPYRIAMLCALRDSGLSLAIAGTGWDQVPELADNVISSEWVNTYQCQQIYGSARFGINLSQENPFDSNEYNQMQISPRIYEMAGAGTIPVSEDLPLGAELFEEISCITFGSIKEFLPAVHSVADATVPDELYLQNVEKVKENHLYRHRAEQIVGWL